MEYFKVNIEERDRWMNYIKKSLFYDFYHSWQYHSTITSGEAFLFVFEENSLFIAIPFIKRPIKNSDYFDLTSAYGYVGPIANFTFSEINNEYLDNFKSSFHKFLDEEKIVSVFSRLHPIIEQNKLLMNIGGVYSNGKTVYIDLNESLESQISNYRKSVRNSIHNFIVHEPVIKEVLDDNDIQLFTDIYQENMKRINANEYYNFDFKYFKDLIKADEFNSKPLILYINDVAAAAGFFVYTNDIIQVHLLATRNDFLSLSPTKNLIHEACKIGRENGMKYIHLGGGVGGNEDNLYFWKTGFSNKTLNFETWRYIHQPEIYEKLSNEYANNKGYQPNFFPSYRSLENS